MIENVQYCSSLTTLRLSLVHSLLYKSVFCFQEETDNQNQQQWWVVFKMLIGWSSFNLILLLFTYCHPLSWVVIYSSFNLNNVRQKTYFHFLLFPSKIDRIIPLVFRKCHCLTCVTVAPVFQKRDLKSPWPISKLDMGPKYYKE